MQEHTASLLGEAAALQMLAEVSPVGLFVLRERVLYANAALADTLGINLEQVLTLDSAALVPAEIRHLLEATAPVAGRPLALTYRLPSSRVGSDGRYEVMAHHVLLEDGPAISGAVFAPRSRPSAAPADEDNIDWFRVLAETTSTAIFVYRDTFLYCNRAFAELTGYDEAELLELDPLKLIHPDYREVVTLRRDARLAGQPVPRSYEILILTHGGEERWVHFTAGRILLQGQAAGLGTAFDITDQKLAELALRASEERLQLAQRAAGIITWDWNLLTDELVVSSPAPASLGLRFETLPKNSEELFLRLVHPEDRDRVLAAVREAVKGGSDYAVEHRVLTAQGEGRWLAARGVAIRDESGWVVRMVGVSADVTERKLAELALKDSNDRLRLIVEQIPAVLWTTDSNLRLTSCVGAGLTNLNVRTERIVGRPLSELFSAESTSTTAAVASTRALSGESVSSEQSLAGHRYQTHVEPLRDAEARITGTIGIALDVTEHRQTEEALRRERERADATLASIDDGVIRTNAFGLIEYTNPVAERLTGVTAEEARGRQLEEIYLVVDEDTRKPLLSPLVRCLRESRPVMLPGRRILVARDGTEFSIRDSAAPIRGADGKILGAVLAFKDVSAVRDMERAMSHLANHDGQTGLLNRQAFEQRLERALARAENHGTLAVLQLDLGQLKVINDTCGHLAGDELIRQVSRRLENLLADPLPLPLARLGAEEFGVLFERTSPQAARERTLELRRAFDDFRFVWHEKSFEVHPNFGLVLAKASDSASALMIAIDVACTLAKESGRNRVHEYQADDEELLERYRQMHWIHRIYRALEEGSFRLFCQPIRPLSGGEEEGLLGEVLIRLLGDDGELVLPRTFVPAAERYRLMPSIDRWVVRKSFELLSRRVTLSGRPISRLAINLSGESLNEEHFLDFVVGELEAFRLPAARVLFEITETAAIANLAGAMRFISELQDRGAGFILDDFGSGLSSFAYLKNLPVDYLKIAGEFVRGIEDSPMHKTLVRSINQIGHELGLKTIAEGVETPEMLRLLEEIQLDYVQGYYIARPEPLAEG